MAPVLAVLRCSDAFEEALARLATAADAQVRVVDSVAALPPDGTACAVLVAAGGVEREAAAKVGELRGASWADVAVVGAELDHRLVASLMRAGASDYFALPSDLGALQFWIAERAERASGAGRARLLAEERRAEYDFSKIVGRSPGLLAALERAAVVIPRSQATVLLTGETGTGKELLAQAIHYNGPRAEQPFVQINCTAIPAGLLEAELFGYEKGAFTDASASKPGLFEAAAGGTLFLDEIGDLSLELQAKLLNVLEERKVRRLGSVRESEVDLRIIAATHVDLGAAVREGRFRQDLYYRLSVVPIHLPPLRERGDDVLLLADQFLARFCATYGFGRPTLTPQLRRGLLAHAWPGNIRELRNSIERALLLGGGVLRREDLFLDEVAAAAPAAGLPFPATMETIQRSAARAMLEWCGGNKSAAADALKISRKWLYALLSDGAG